MVVGDRRLAARAALDDEQGVHLVDPPEEEGFGGESEIGRIAAAMRAFEDRLGGSAVERVVLAGSSDLALAAMLVASKIRVPVAAIGIDPPSPAGDVPRKLNRRLIEQLADAVLPDDAPTLAVWLAAPQPPAPSRGEH
jgi:hypothetical protein